MSVAEASEVMDPFQRLPGELISKILANLEDLKLLSQCMVVCKSWNVHSREVEEAVMVCPDNHKNYWEKVMIITKRIQSFPRLKRLCTRLGEGAVDARETTSSCMRYAEIGADVDKFVFVAGRSNHNDRLKSTGGCPLEIFTGKPEMVLKQVVAPGDEGLKRMMPVLAFAITRGFDELRDALPCLLLKVPSLKQLLLVDVFENVTINIREHHVQQLRDGKRSPKSSAPNLLQGNSLEDVEAGAGSVREEASSFEVSFWRSDKVICVDRSLYDISVCVATQAPSPLSLGELDHLTDVAIGGGILASTISSVNRLTSCHHL